MDHDKEWDSSDSNLLYDILVYKEWPEQPDPKILDVLQTQDTQNHSTESWSHKVSSLLKWSGSIASGNILPEKVAQIFSSRCNWEICLSDDVSLLAILQDALLEIYQKDVLQTPISKIRVDRDPMPTYRKLCWSPDGSLLAVTSSNGRIDIYDSYGFIVYTIFSQKLPGHDSSHSVQNSYAGVFFTDLRVKSREWIYELILIDFTGKINSFLLSPSGYQEFTTYSVFSGQSLLKQATITAVSYSQQHGLLYIAGPAAPSESSGPSRYGLSILRLLGEPPYYDFVPPYDQPVPGASPSRLLLSTYLYSGRRYQQDHIYSMEISPNGKEICCVHVSGAISVWQLPALRPSLFLPIEEQPSFDDMNPSLLQNPKLKKRKKQFLKNDLKWLPLRVKWWSENALIVLRYSGGVSIISIEKCQNLLGESSEFFAGVPTVSNCFEGGFYLLECETTTARKKNYSETELTEDLSEDELSGDISSDNDDEDELSWLQRGKKIANVIAYNLTESERFAPQRKKPRLMMQTYKLLSLMSTTPSELYSRKIELEEYGEALILAQHYNLDSDQVYERQWKLSDLSVTAIHDYLSKIKRRSLVLRECVKTVPGDVNAIRELLLYGLKETDSDIISSDSDDVARFIESKAVELIPSYLSEEEMKRERIEREERLLSKVNWQNLTVYQKDILSQRRLILRYLDRLDGYLSILEEDADYQKRRLDMESEFEPAKYIKFRIQPLIRSAVEFARDGRIGALASLLSRYPLELCKYTLPILNNIPESISPLNYSHLIPFQPVVKRGLDSSLSRDKDWSDFEFIRQSLPVDPAVDNENDVRSTVKSFSSKYVVDKPTSKSTLSIWVNDRARNVFEESGLVDHALALLNCADINGIRIDAWLQHRLLIVETLMFSLHDNSLSLRKLEEMSHLETVLKLMEGCTAQTFPTRLSKILGPYMDRLEILEPGSRTLLLQNYLLHLSATSLEFPTIFFKEFLSTDDISRSPYFSSVDDCISVGIDCIYQLDGEEDEKNHIVDLASFLRKKSSCPRMREELSDILDIMRTIELVNKYHIHKSLQYFKSCRSDEKVMQELCQQIARRAEGKKPRLNAREWSEVLQDLFELRRLCPLILTEWFCVETLCNSLICSESKDSIKLVQDVFSHSIADVLFKSTAKSSPLLYILSMYKIGPIPSDMQKRVVVNACQFYFDSSRDVDDPNLEFVRSCLQLLPEKEKNLPELKPIYNFLNALEMLREFGVSMLPVVLKSSDNQKNIIRKILQVDPQAYKNVRKIIRLVRLLSSVREIHNEDEAEILSLVADFAIKSSDFEACKTICDILMTSHANSAVTCDVCSRLVGISEFENSDAKARIASFCVAYCNNEMIEEMLERRKELSPLLNLPIEEESPESKFHIEELTAQPVALVKAAAEQTTKALPEAGTRAITSLWGKLTKLTPILQQSAPPEKEGQPEEVPKMRVVVEEEMERSMRPPFQLVVDPFYSHLHEGCRADKLGSTFEVFSKYRCMDEASLRVIKEYIEKSCKVDTNSEDVDWLELKDVLVDLVVSHDCSLGVSLLLTEFRVREPVVTQEVLENPKMVPYVLYIASLHALMQRLADKTFQTPPGLLYACAKTLNMKKRLESELFESALAIADI